MVSISAAAGSCKTCSGSGVVGDPFSPGELAGCPDCECPAAHASPGPYDVWAVWGEDAEEAAAVPLGRSDGYGAALCLARAFVESVPAGGLAGCLLHVGAGGTDAQDVYTPFGVLLASGAVGA